MISVFPRNCVSRRVLLACQLVLSIVLIPSVSVAESAPQSVATTSFASLLQVLFGLGLVLAAIAGTAWLLRRLAPGQVAAAGSLRVVGGVAVGPKERVLLVDVGDTRLVLGVTSASISTLHQMPKPTDAESAPEYAEATAPFYLRLKEMLNKKGQV
jgi:flagellar protein FliO/FliZ